MKLYAIILSLAVGLGLASTAQAEAQVKEVCKEVIGKDGKPMKDAKGKPVQKCTKIKVHKKVEGEKVPDNKKK
jgi:hypothetical protein